MKELLIIKTHSFIDVITNSSTELFVCDKDKTLEQVKELLEEKWKPFCELYNYSGEVWEHLEVHIITKEDVEKAEKERKESEWGFWLDDYGVDYKEGDIHIMGTADNSIPYAFWDVIESQFNASRHHLG